MVPLFVPRRGKLVDWHRHQTGTGYAFQIREAHLRRLRHEAATPMPRKASH